MTRSVSILAILAVLAPNLAMAESPTVNGGVGLHPLGPSVNFAAGDSSATYTLPFTSGTLFIENMTANAVCMDIGASAVNVAGSAGICTTGDFLGPFEKFTYAAGTATSIALTDATNGSSSTVKVRGGSGSPIGWGGGSGAGNSGPSGNVFQATIGAQGTASTATTTQIVAAVGTETIYLVNYAFQTDAGASAAGTFQLVSGTGTNCSTITKTLTPPWNFAANAGIGEGSIGVLGISSPGDEMCVVTTTANKILYRVGVAQQ